MSYYNMANLEVFIMHTSVSINKAPVQYVPSQGRHIRVDSQLMPQVARRGGTEHLNPVYMPEVVHVCLWKASLD